SVPVLSGPGLRESSAVIMPTSRPGSEPVEFWVEGSRRDGTVEEFYTLSSELGRGATSIVYRCEEKQTQKPYAVKVLKKTVSDLPLERKLRSEGE
uniref:Protein kinase domain-containing protein n=1 Tax=Seriola dumerili TaxID=41447 RepID=A0A3B4VDB9_SERDU